MRGRPGGGDRQVFGEESGYHPADSSDIEVEEEEDDNFSVSDENSRRSTYRKID